ncbi:transcription termination/antitermination protein NusG [Mycoplasma corogypsi]|uniref:transcription termination/antitermination protein NusG n=1 Tax=Mycoplasma corogypsi TaxID=2106 RepID=UPI0038734989
MIERKKWYMISTVRGKEENVIEALKNRIHAEQVEDDFDLEATPEGPFRMFTRPSLTAKELEKKLAGDEYKVKRVNLYSGYIFAKMEMSDKAWFVIRNTQYVTGLIGSSGKGAKPTPVSALEMKKMSLAEQQAQHDFDLERNLQGYKVDDVVRITSTAFKNQIGTIAKIILEKNAAIVLIENFGKRIETEVSLDDIELTE